MIECNIGGVKSNVLIDSGCKLNLLTTETWEYMKRNKIQVSNQIKNPNMIFKAYGSTSPLKVKGSFEAVICINNHRNQATFYVIEDGSADLLGKETAKMLGILKVGLAINQIDISPFPKFKGILVHIPIEKSVRPISQPYRRIPIPLEEKIEEKLIELKANDIIEDVTCPSEWVSSMVPVLKENGDVRLCIDMRRANEAILRENHPLPTMDNILPKINKAKFFSRIDIKLAFHQIEIHTSSRYITTFISRTGLKRYKRLMFGISCAPEIFQKTLERILINCEGTVNFIYDILVFGRDKKEHDRRLEKVLNVLKGNNVLLNDDKCVYGVTKTQFLGHELTCDGVRLLDKYIKSIQNFRAPSTIEELQSFLGLVNYVGKWIPHLATTTEPLKVLTRKNDVKTQAYINIGPQSRTMLSQNLRMIFQISQH